MRKEKGDAGYAGDARCGGSKGDADRSREREMHLLASRTPCQAALPSTRGPGIQRSAPHAMQGRYKKLHGINWLPCVCFLTVFL